MNNTLNSTKPEEKELRDKLSKLENLKNELIEKELALVSIQRELNYFQIQYMKIVGVRIIKLDEIKAQISEVLEKLNKFDYNLAREAKRFRNYANESAEILDEIDRKHGENINLTPSESLKSLYREAAKCIHPDFAHDEKDAAHRTKLMAEINEAYKSGDIDTIKNIISDWENKPENILGNDIGSILIRTIRHIAIAQKRLQEMEENLQNIMNSPLYFLREKLANENENITKALHEMAEKIDQQINDQQNRLDSMIDIYIKKDKNDG